MNGWKTIILSGPGLFFRAKMLFLGRVYNRIKWIWASDLNIPSTPRGWTFHLGKFPTYKGITTTWGEKNSLVAIICPGNLPNLKISARENQNVKFPPVTMHPWISRNVPFTKSSESVKKVSFYRELPASQSRRSMLRRCNQINFTWNHNICWFCGWHFTGQVIIPHWCTQGPWDP